MISLITPTLNRSDFLTRQLHYLADMGFKGSVLLGDASDKWHFKETEKTIQRLKGKLNVRHYECRGLSILDTKEFLGQRTTTPYCVFLADDDFICPSGLYKCVDFLEHNPDYGLAYGFTVSTRIWSSSPYGDVKQVYRFPHPPMDTDSGVQRLQRFLAAGSYATVHDVHRTSDWQEVLKGSIGKPWSRHGILFDGLTPSIVSATRSKAKELDCFYTVRYGHDAIYFNDDDYKMIKDMRSINEVIFLSQR